jgi:thiosulfate/3-mercaptopyruvate sulfurtransferase
MGPLVSFAWLADRLHDSNVVVLDATLPPLSVTPPVDTRARYVAEHLPGTVFFDIDALSDHSSPFPHMLPPAEDFSRKMSELGVGDSMTIVIYEQRGVFSAPRAWWMLRAFGAKHVCLLDGDFSAWKDAGLPVQSGEGTRPSACFHARLDRDAVKSFSQVQEMIAAGADAQILDARSAGRFAGDAPEPRPGLSSGHMPGAVNIPFTALAEEGRLKNADELRALFREKGVDLARPITTTCGSGVTAAVIALGLEIAGAIQVSLYDGSWAEYAQQPGAVIQKS